MNWKLTEIRCQVTQHHGRITTKGNLSFVISDKFSDNHHLHLHLQYGRHQQRRDRLLDILKQELFMSDHTHTMTLDQVIIKIYPTEWLDKIYDQAILEDLSSTGNFQTCIETDVIENQDTMIHTLCPRLGHDG